MHHIQRVNHKPHQTQVYHFLLQTNRCLNTQNTNKLYNHFLKQQNEDKNLIYPFTKPSNLRVEQVIAAQRACFDRPYRWLWYFTRYHINPPHIKAQDPQILASWLIYLSELITDDAMFKFCTSLEYKMMKKHQKYVNINNDVEKLKYNTHYKISNPLLEIVKQIMLRYNKKFPILFLREALSHCFSRAIPPSGAALYEIVDMAPKILHCGYALTGYWSYILSQAKCDVKCLSSAKPYYPNDLWNWNANDTIVESRPGDYLKSINGKDDDRALLYIFPQDTYLLSNPRLPIYEMKTSNHTFHELKYWNGDTVITISPLPSNTTFDVGLKFFPPKEISKEWKVEKEINIPQWPGFRDCVRVFKRV